MNEQAWIEEGWLFHNHAWHLLHEFLKNISKNFHNLLDIGAGTGIAASVIKAIYPGIDITVTDITRESEPFWIKRNLKGVIIKDEKFPFDDKHFDFVMSSHVIEHIDDPVLLIREAWRVCNKRLMIAVPDGDVNFYDHKIIFNRSNFQDIIQKALQNEKYKSQFYPFYHTHINNLIGIIDR